MVSEGLNNNTPAWASILGVIAIMLGVFLTAVHANEAMKQAVIVEHMPASGVMPEADCPPEELEEEGISVAECEYLIEHVKGMALSAPDWFPSAQMTLAGIGALLAFISIIIGGALVNYTPSASVAAVAVFSGLAIIDLLQFAAVVNTGPTLREVYLGGILLWFVLHLMLLVGAIAGRHTQANA
ncbi:hypothetical protein LP43_1318 [Methylophaga thiooxydans]|uniref:Uncharacterized protein n=1 Tax=Methylophaga thiooxydans TaxID=392484 RepID=A0A0A0BFX0_9GAMM|nr:hypothetical protein [Methylophaga thiooxydans]KGM06826.1 hypothetical protein LP43_1318 [Methylophaga thiooxydans]